MNDIPARIVIQQGLELMPAIQEIIENADPRLKITVCGDDNLMAAEHADIVVLGGNPDEEATLDRVWALCRPPHHPKVLLISSVMAQQYYEQAIVQGASGVLDKSSSARLILKAVGCVARGELWLDRQTTGRVFDRLSRSIIRKKRFESHAAQWR